MASCALAAPQAGLVGPSGSIGPSGIVGPSGPVQFNQPAWAFLGNHAHAHVAAHNRHRFAQANAQATVSHQEALQRHAAALAAHRAALGPQAVHYAGTFQVIINTSNKKHFFVIIKFK